MADPARFVNSTETQIREIVNCVQKIKSIADDLTYRSARLGGASYTDTHFYESDGVTLREDLNYSKDDFSTALYNVSIIGDVVGNDEMAALMKVSG